MLMVATVKGESLPRKEARLKGRLRRPRREALPWMLSQLLDPARPESRNFPSSQKGYKSRGPDISPTVMRRDSAADRSPGCGRCALRVISMGAGGKGQVSPTTEDTTRGLETKS